MKFWVSFGAVAASAGLALSTGALAQTTSGSTGSDSSSMKMTQAECQSLWQQAGTSSAESLSQSQAQTLVRDFKSADANSDGKLSKAEFQQACDKGMVQHGAGTGAGSGASGSGSSTDSGSTGSSGSGSSN